MSRRHVALLDAVRATFGFPAALAILLAVVVGMAMPAVDGWLGVKVPFFDFADPEAARSILETIATVTVSVVGIAFSVTVVAFTLSANQLSPRVLRSFRRDLLSQLTLAAFLGTAVYCLSVLARLGTLGGERVPSLSLALATFLGLGAFALFAGFIGHITNMLQPSSVIASISEEARPHLTAPFPAEAGAEPDDPARARERFEAALLGRRERPVRAAAEGFLVELKAGDLLELAAAEDFFVRQRVSVGAYAMPQQALATAWLAQGDDGDRAEKRLRGLFRLGPQRTLPQDPGFPIRQLADVALRGLSPGLNDPTTAVNAMEAMSAGLLRFARADRPSPLRTDAHGCPRLLVEAPGLGELVELGFAQVLSYAEKDPVVPSRLRELLGEIAAAARENDLPAEEIERLALRP